MSQNTWNPSNDAMLAMVRNIIKDKELTDEQIATALYNESLADVSPERVASIRMRAEQGEYPSW